MSFRRVFRKPSDCRELQTAGRTMVLAGLRLVPACAVLLLCCGAGPAWAQLADPWQSTYSGEHATGPHVIGLWQFEKEAPGADASGNGRTAVLRESQIATGRFGGGLESFPGWPVNDKPHGATVASAAELSPSGPFTLEMWISPKESLSTVGRVYLLDKMYASSHDYQWTLEAPDGNGRRTLRVALGFGETSEHWFSAVPVELKPGTWTHLAFTYDGAGTGEFVVNGVPRGRQTHAGRGSLTAGRHALTLGDRVGSLYGGFPGYLDQIRICRGVREFRPVSVEASPERTVFVRHEPQPKLHFTLKNLRNQPLESVRATLSGAGLPVLVQELEDLPAGAEAAVEIPFDTGLRPGTYAIRCDVEGISGGGQVTSAGEISLQLVRRSVPNRMPVVMWGVGGTDGVVKEIPRLKQIGFTHCLGLSMDYGAVWKAGQPVPAATGDQFARGARMLDRALASDLRIVLGLAPGHWLDRSRREMLRIDRDGKPYSRENACVLFDQVKPFFRNVGASAARTWSRFPAFEAVLVNTEVRDGSQICFHEHDLAAYRAATGQEYPPEVQIKNGVQWTTLPDFPKDRVIPDDHPLLTFYRWFWTRGDGWNAAHSAVDEGFETAKRPDQWTFFDPAVRVPSIGGSGGSVDVISHWTYSYPDPIRIGLATDELMAMARAARQPQQVMKMTQVIWYRSQTAPKPKGQQAAAGSAKDEAGDSSQSAWEDYDPDADYITIAPMHLREAFWTKISRPVQGIMYHGWQSLVPVDHAYAYRYTHPETQHELTRLVHEVVQPYGPMLKQMPEAPADVAFLESFSSQMFARRGTYGWGGSLASEVWHTLQYAGLQPQIVYDETIREQGLDDYRMLVLADCDVLTESVVAEIQKFQKRGGIVVADTRVAPAISADITVESAPRSGNAQPDREALVQRALKLKEALAGRYAADVQTSSPDLIARRRKSGRADCVFVVNDRREYGDYVGHHQRVMENGLPTSGTLSVKRAGGVVYDLLARRAVRAATAEGRLTFDVDLGPCDGRMYLITERPLADIATTVAHETVAAGEQITVSARVQDDRGETVDAVIPMEVEIRDAAGRTAEFSGYYGAAGGKLALQLDIAPNDRPGLWRVRFRELASGLERSAYFRVTAADR